MTRIISIPEQLRLFLKHESREVVLLHGFYISYILILGIAAVVDFLWNKYVDASSELIFLLLCLGVAYYYYRTRDTRLPSYAAVWIAATNLYILLFNNGFDNHVIIFAILLPLAPFFLLSLKEAFIHTFFFYLFLSLLMYYSSVDVTEHALLLNPAALINLAYAVFFIMSFGFFYHISVENAYRNIKESDHQKEILLKEVHHRVKNNLNMIASMLGLQANMSDDIARSKLLDSKSRIEAIAMVHEMLYQTGGDFASIDFESYVRRLTFLIRSLFNRDDEIDITIESENISLPLEVMLQLGLIINELLNNSLKYAFEPGAPGRINIILKHTNNDYLLIYHDDGKGYPDIESLLEAKSLGIKLIRLAVKQLKGQISLSDIDGLTYRIEFHHE